MKRPNLVVSAEVVTSIVLGVIVLLTATTRQVLFGVVAVALVEAWRWWQQDKLNLESIQSDCWLLLVGLSGVVILTLNPVLLSQIVLAAAYVAWRWWLLTEYQEKQHVMIAAAVSQTALLWAVFLAAAVWHWSAIIVLVLAWAGSWLIGQRVFLEADDRAGQVLALTWALLVAECSWVFSLWLVSYIIFAGFLIIPQPALVLTALGYCLAGIYTSHRRSQLSRTRLIEYLMVGLVILVIVIAGTKWNGVI